MPHFSKRSAERLATCDRRLQWLFYNVISLYDCTIVQGHRSLEEQQALFEAGRSKVRRGKHNESPSLAVDVAPWLPGRGIPWPKPGTKSYIKDLAQFYHFAGFVMAVAENVHVPIRWGGDWDRDYDLSDQTFDDLVHFELRNSGEGKT